MAVFVDATSAIASDLNITRPFHELEYRWDFGDKTGVNLNLSPPGTGTSTWNTGSNPGVSSRNTATGPVAAHVYETPGTYTIALTVTDGTNTISNDCTQITVQDPNVIFGGSSGTGPNTICVGSTSAPTPGLNGCPAGALGVQQASFTTAINTYAKTGKRVLFRRGDTFTIATSAASITSNGPGMVGAFGSGNLPLVQVTLNDRSIFSLSSGPTPAFNDWRIMDLEIDGMGGSIVSGIGNGGGVTRVTLLRVTMRRFEAAIGIADGNPNYWNNYAAANNRPDLGGHTVDQVAIVDSTITYGPNTHYGGYNAGNRLAFMGNYIDNGGLNISRGDPINGSHVARFPYLAKAVISNNSLERPGFDRLAIKLHGPTWTGSYAGAGGSPDPASYSAALNGDGYSKQVVISDNKLTDFINPWAVAIGPQSASTDERVKDVIIERNMHVGTDTSQVTYAIRSRETTLRNNLILGGANTTRYGVRVEVDGPEPPARDVWIYNNTQYTAGAVPANEFVMVSLGGIPNVINPAWGNATNTPSNITAKNNLAYASNATNPRFYTNAGATNVVVSNNSSDAQIKNGPAPFTVPVSMPSTLPPFTVPAGFLDNFRLAGGSYAINTGAAVPVRSDFFLTPQSGVPDLGAVVAP